MDAVDSSVLVASLVESEPHYRACSALLDKAGLILYSHGLAETFNTLTGGRSGYRIPASQVAELIETSILPYVEVISLSPKEMVAALHQAQPRGVRGAAVFDYLHLVATRKAKASRLHTLNVTDFRAFHRPGDPDIVHP